MVVFGQPGKCDVTGNFQATVTDADHSDAGPGWIGFKIYSDDCVFHLRLDGHQSCCEFFEAGQSTPDGFFDEPIVSVEWFKEDNNVGSNTDDDIRADMMTTIIVLRITNESGNMAKFWVSNSHNGYYSHLAEVIKDGEVLYSRYI